MPESAHRIVIAGSLTRDRVYFAKAHTQVPGGVVWHAGRTLAALGASVTVVTRTAPDARSMLNPLIEAGVQVVWEPASHTTTLILRYDQEDPESRSFEVEALAEAVQAKSLNQPLEDADTLYLGPVHQHDLDPDWLRAIREHAPHRVALDVQGLLRQHSGHRLVPGCSPHLDEWLAVTDVLKMSEKEARTLLGEETMASTSLVAALAEKLCGRLRGRELVVTCGLEGAWAWHEGNVSYAAAQPVPGDSTGAGDVFFATYLARRGAGDAAAVAASAASAQVARQMGSRKTGPPA